MLMYINFCIFNSKLVYIELFLYKEYKNYWMIVCLFSKKIEFKV